MFRYLLFGGLGIYLVLLIGGEDRGQERAGLRGAYAIDLAMPVAAEAPAPTATLTATPAPRSAPPADTIRILPMAETTPTPAVLEQAAAPAEPAFNDFNTPTVILRTVTADAANVRNAASRSATVIGRVERGEVVQLVEEVGDWVHVRIEGDGVEGFVHRSLLSDEAPALSTYGLFPAAD